jgi:glycosyltransferase involved in cell wall biosynthesis
MPGKVVGLDVSSVMQSDILKKWNLENGQFYFYPAQFWAHKNHYALVQAFAIVSQKNPSAKLVLSGSDKGNKKYIEELVSKLNLSEKVLFVGFISDEEVFALYKNAIALVMPTLLGPTNMPLLEAHALGCPVLCSNLQGHQKQMGDKAIYFDPLNPSDIADKMSGTILRHPAYKDETDYGKILNDHFKKLLPLRRTFGH